MKNRRLQILIVSFVLLLLQPGKAFSANNDASPKRANQIAASIFQFPHTELELHGNQWTNAAASSYRIQGGNDSLPHSEFRLAHVPCMHSIAAAGNGNVSFKDYLFHNYPSHNFW